MPMPRDAFSHLAFINRKHRMLSSNGIVPHELLVLWHDRTTVTRVTLDGVPVTLKSIQSSLTSVVAVHPLGTTSLNPTPDSVGLFPPPTIDTDGIASFALLTSMAILPAGSAITLHAVMDTENGIWDCP